VNDEMKKKICKRCKQLMTAGVCIACAAGAVVAGPSFHRTDATSGSQTVMFRLLTTSEVRIREVYAAAEDRSDPLHTENSTGLRTDVDLVTIGSISTDDPPSQRKYPRQQATLRQVGLVKSAAVLA
jgi:hypothetical protein